MGNQLNIQRKVLDELFFTNITEARNNHFDVPQLAVIAGLGIYEAYKGTDVDDGSGIIKPANSDIRLRLIGTAGAGAGDPESITTLVDNGNGSFTYTNEDGDIVTYTSPVTSGLDDLADVDITTLVPVSGDVLTWDGANFTPDQIVVEVTAALMGVASMAPNLGTFTGSTITSNGDTKSALQELETALEDSASEVTASLVGVAPLAPNLGTFSGATVTANGDIKTALQEIETALEASEGIITQNRTVTGISDNDTDLGTFTGDIISDATTIKTAFQEVETEIELLESQTLATIAGLLSVNVIRTNADIILMSSDEGDSGNARGIVAGQYHFDNSLDMGLLHFILLDDGNYSFTSTNVNFISYSGTLPWITNVASTPNLLVKILDTQISTPNAKAIDLTGVGSLIMRLAVFVFCLKAVEYTDSLFMTGRGVAIVGCADGITANNVDTLQIDTLQMNAGTSSGVGLTLMGAGKRLILSGCDARPEAAEAYIEVQASYTGTVSMTGGSFDSTGEFFRGVRDQKDPSIEVANIVHVKDSGVNAFSVSLDNSLVTSIPSANTPVKINAVWIDETKERFTFDSSGRWTYTGLEDVDIKASFVGTIKDDEDGDRIVSVYLAKNGTVINSTQGGKVSIKTGSQLTSRGEIPMATGDYIEAFVENNDDDKNQVAIYCNMTINS